jgi:hypothetical protein
MRISYNIDPNIENQFTSYLGPEESLIWTGRPSQGIKFNSYDLFYIPFSFIWASFALSNIFSTISQPINLFSLLFELIFLGLGVYITIGRFFFDALKRRYTYYAITSKSILIKSGIFFKEIDTLDIGSTYNINLKEKSNKSGTIIFGPEDPRNPFFKRRNWQKDSSVPIFEFIQNVKEVYDLIIQIRDDS